jgi:hypothetical protein
MAYQNTVNPVNTSAGFTGSKLGNPSVQTAYVFADLQKPDISEMLTYRFPQYTLTTLLDRLGRNAGVRAGDDTFSWFEKGRFRKSYAVGAGSSGLTGGTTATVKLLSTTVADANLLVGDVLRFENDQFGFITAIAQNSADVDLTVSSADGNWDLGAGDAFGHLYNAQTEFSDSPSGRVWQEEQVTEKLAIMRRSVICSTTEAGNIKWIDGGRSYYFRNEMETLKEFQFDKEMYILTGKSFGTLSTTGRQSGNGIIPRVLVDGVVGNYSSAIVETDIQAQVENMILNSPAREYTVLCGIQAFGDIQKALAPYVMDGGMNYGSLGTIGNKVGLNIQQYQYMGVTLNLQQYLPFSDTTIFPKPVNGGIDYGKVALFVNMGSDSEGTPLISLKHKEDGFGNSLAFRRTVQSGISTPEGNASVNRSNGKDGFTVDLYASIGVELRAVNNHGILLPS